MGEYRDIRINDLVVNSENPRFVATENERQAIYAMLEDQGLAKRNKIVALAKDIAENGLSPLETILVSPLEDGRYLVREGNRRITAIKLALDQNKIPDEFLDLRIALFDCRDGMPSVIRGCYVTQDEDEINALIGARHAGQQQGVGVVPWNREQKSRYNRLLTGKPDKTIALIDQLCSEFGIESDLCRYLNRIPRSGLNRLLGTPEVRRSLGIVLDKGVYFYLGGSDELLRATLKTVSELHVGEYYDVNQRKKLIESIKKSLDHDSAIDNGGTGSAPGRQTSLPISGDEGTPQTEDVSDPSTDCGDEPVNGAAIKKPVGYPHNRKTVIPNGHTLHTMQEARISCLHKELKKLDAENYPNAAYLLLRTFIQLCADRYLTKKGLSLGRKSTLKAKIQRVCEELEKEKVLDHCDLETLRRFARDDDEASITTTTLNATAHSRSWVPLSLAELTGFWDGVYLVLEKMLDDRDEGMARRNEKA